MNLAYRTLLEGVVEILPLEKMFILRRNIEVRKTMKDTISIQKGATWNSKVWKCDMSR